LTCSSTPLRTPYHSFTLRSFGVDFHSVFYNFKRCFSTNFLIYFFFSNLSSAPDVPASPCQCQLTVRLHHDSRQALSFHQHEPPH
jgi:hypothetical protein